MSEQYYPPLPEAAAIHGFQRVYISDQMRDYAAAAIAQQSARHAEELAAYALTVSNLRAQRVPDGLIDVLRGGKQCDEDGTEIIMSRQACCEAADILEELSAASAPQAPPERKPTTDDECVTLFRRVQRGMGFKDQDVIPFTSGVAAGEHFHGIKEKP